MTWDADGTVAGGKLTLTATTQVKMSSCGIGPITVAGLVSTSDDVTLTMKLTALDPSKFTIPSQIAAPPAAPRSNDSPSFASVVMPALEANCASCHNPGQVGAAHWTLNTAADAKKISDGIGSVVGNGYMPPWPASPHGVALLNSKRSTKRRSMRSCSGHGRRPARRPGRHEDHAEGRPAGTGAAQGHRVADAPGVRGLADRAQRLPLLRPRSAPHASRRT